MRKVKSIGAIVGVAIHVFAICGCLSDEDYVRMAKMQNPSFVIPERTCNSYPITRSQLIGRWEGGRQYELYRTWYANVDWRAVTEQIYTTLTLDEDGYCMLTEEWSGMLVSAEQYEGTWEYEGTRLSLHIRGNDYDYKVDTLEGDTIELSWIDLKQFERDLITSNHKIWSWYNNEGCLCSLIGERWDEHYLQFMGPTRLKKMSYKKVIPFVATERKPGILARILDYNEGGVRSHDPFADTQYQAGSTDNTAAELFVESVQAIGNLATAQQTSHTAGMMNNRNVRLQNALAPQVQAGSSTSSGRICPVCMGSRRCRPCNGHGVIGSVAKIAETSSSPLRSGIAQRNVVCGACGGTGNCRSCGGTGRQ